jgi:hypothetical protein
MSYTSDYVNLLIKQYWEKPDAKAEIELKAATYQKAFELLNRFPIEMDLDEAYGDRLDIIGSIVGISRVIPDVIPKISFGFDGNADSRGFASKFEPRSNSAPFARKFEPEFTPLTLNDSDYYLFIKAKIAKNIGEPFMAVNGEVSIQSAVNDLFSGQAYIVDKFNMTLILYITSDYDLVRLNSIVNLGLLPKPQGVRYAGIVQAEVTNSFGFSNNPSSKGFASKFDNREGGFFARKVIL